MSNAYRSNGEWRAAGLVFRDDFISALLTRRNSVVLIDDGLGFASFNNGMVLDGVSQYATYAGPGLSAIVGSPELFLMLRFTPTFAHDDGNEHVLIDSTEGAIVIVKTAANGLLVTLGNTPIATIAAGTYGGSWNTNQENTLIISSESGDTSAWLNGTNILSGDATAWTPQRDETLLVLGSADGGGSYFAGTYHELAIGNQVLDILGVAEADLRLETTLSDLDVDRAVLALPGKQDFARAADGLRVTEALGTAGITEVLMGSDGATATEFPDLLQPRGFDFDSIFPDENQLNAGDNDAFTFADGAGDLPMSIACIVQAETLPFALYLLSKATGANTGEYFVYSIPGLGLIVQLIDNTDGGYRGRRTDADGLPVGVRESLVVSYSGLGTPTDPDELGIWVGSSKEDVAVVTNGAYTRMRNTAIDLRPCAGVGPAGSEWDGEMTLLHLLDRQLTALQARALAARLKIQDRVS